MTTTNSTISDSTPSKYTDLDSRWGEYSAFHDPYLLANFTARSSDVLITTAPKAGTTWMQQILYQLMSGADTDYSNIFDVIPWLECPIEGKTSEQRLLELEEQKSPRVFKTHCTYPQTPGVNTVRIVLSSRDPRDCCVSFYHHMMSLTDAVREKHDIEVPASFDAYFEQWMEYASWYRNVESWWPHISDENVLWLRYEDMLADLPLCVDRLLQFLSWTLSPEKRLQAIDNSSFIWMKSHSEKFIPKLENGEPVFKPGGFIRKGQVGDHKTLLSVEQETMIIDRAREVLPQACLNFLDLG